jgi:2-dehydropantoate 2-reductase
MPRCAIIGSGGVGGYFGARLARAGHETILVAREQHLEAIRRAGLRIEEPDESFAVGATATDDTEEIGCVDYIVFAVKLWDAEAAAAAISGASASVTHTSAQTSTMLASTTLR